MASRGASLAADFEIGSVSKGITGLLYAEALSRGELGPDTTLGERLPLADCPAAGVTLVSLGRHSSGLPRLPSQPGTLRRTLALTLHGTNPYGETLAELLDQARTVRLPAGLPVPRPRYSNFGFELLGHAVAAGAGLSFQGLLRERLAVPLGLSSVYAPAAAAEVRPTAVTGRSRSGRMMQPWTGEALAPAGGIRASISDMARLVQALLDGSAPGLAALDPVANFTGPAARIGAGWMTLEVKGRRVTWHNGGTGGFRSSVGLDRKAGGAVVLLTATAAPVDRHGFRLLQELAARSWRQ
ncbi:serine hydrolase domain-containing protein [Arthrobacter globiformis]|uniref:serine hydrolase domain-containing protein n=1 Tax=Arthrobacter globiformis TaxID=1665 RepID=UPI00279258C3|nr:serine hydrolase domain-containing protein [Arthrobacter globiformis]MDQ0617247.1 CubicO group peptidase (beta-lactamase class C family) [Arthrobacter globiformis]